ncbi:MAG: hypothetical protein ACFFD4_00250 [Candidatus Odinarchaeota archaeon]
MTGLRSIGTILGGFGGLLITIYGILAVINNLFQETIDLSAIIFYFAYPFSSLGLHYAVMEFSLLGALVMIHGLITVFSYGYYSRLRNKEGNQSKMKGNAFGWIILANALTFISLFMLGTFMWGHVLALIGLIILLFD